MTKTNREELYQLIAIANAERDRRDRIEEIVGNILFSVLGSCVLYTIVLWATR
jgi:hypothetical protein